MPEIARALCCHCSIDVFRVSIVKTTIASGILRSRFVVSLNFPCPIVVFRFLLSELHVLREDKDTSVAGGMQHT